MNEFISDILGGLGLMAIMAAPLPIGLILYLMFANWWR